MLYSHKIPKIRKAHVLAEVGNHFGWESLVEIHILNYISMKAMQYFSTVATTQCINFKVKQTILEYNGSLNVLSLNVLFYRCTSFYMTFININFKFLGRRDIIDFMLNIEAPAAVYDNVGTCAVALMAEKMPDLAKKALDQFLVEDKPTRINYFHLCALEYDTRCKIGRTPAKSVLEVSALYDSQFPNVDAFLAFLLPSGCASSCNLVSLLFSLLSFIVAL